MSYDVAFDDKGRPAEVLVGNESEDGSGTWHAIVCNSSGQLVMSLQSISVLRYGAASSLTIATGVVAVTKTRHKIVVQGGTGGGNDQLDTATGGSDGDVLILQSATSGGSDTVTVADGTGADTFILAGNANFVMDSVDDRLTLLHNGTEWVETSRSANS